MDITDDYRPELLKKIYWITMNKSFFNTIFSSVEGHAKNIDEYLKDEQS